MKVGVGSFSVRCYIERGFLRVSGLVTSRLKTVAQAVSSPASQHAVSSARLHAQAELYIYWLETMRWWSQNEIYLSSSVSLILGCSHIHSYYLCLQIAMSTLFSR